MRWNIPSFHLYSHHLQYRNLCLSPVKTDEISCYLKEKKEKKNQQPPFMLNPIPSCLPQLSHSLKPHHTSRSPFLHWPTAAQLQHPLLQQKLSNNLSTPQAALNSQLASGVWPSSSSCSHNSTETPSHHLPSVLTMTTLTLTIGNI